MDVLEGVFQAAEMLRIEYILGQGLLHGVEDFCEKGGLQFGESLVAEAGGTETLGARIDAREGSERVEALRRGFIHLGMDHIVLLAENGRLAEYHVLPSGLEFVLHPFDALEEDEVDAAGSVVEGGHQAACLVFSEHLHRHDAAAQLDIGGG